VIFQDRLLKFLKCYDSMSATTTNCSPAASFADCVMTPYLFKVHLQTFLSTPITQKCQILSCDTLVANERYDDDIHVIRHSHLALPATGIVTRIAHLFLRSSFAKYVHSIAASLASLSVKQCCVPS